jgi:TetR/AcrR family transcriptional repressor of nem operon
MPWPSDHKARTRTKIVAAASTAFRAGGVAGVRIEDVMAQAGLTHGGFYAHFASKTDLLRDALDYANEQTIDALSTSVADLPDELRWRTVIDAYLSPAHLAHPEVGCPVACMGPEIARADRATRKRFARAVKARLAWMRRLLASRGRKAVSDEDVIGSTACMVGGMVLARAVGGREANEILRACRDFLHRQESQRRHAHAGT